MSLDYNFYGYPAWMEEEMYPFIDESVHLSIKNILERTQERRIISEQESEIITINDIDDLLEYMTKRISNSVEVMNKHAKVDLSIAYFGSLILGLMALNLADESKYRPINTKWLYPEREVDPNKILESLLINITNQCFSITNLALIGYAWSARILLRTTLELTWLTLVLVSDREKMIIYSQEVDDASERKLFQNHFSGRKLQKALVQLEQRLNLPPDVIENLINVRSDAYSLFTKHVHNSFPLIYLGSRAPALDKSDWLDYALFNTPSTSAQKVISSLNEQILFYLIGILPSTLKDFHLFPISKSWDDIVILRECFVQLFIKFHPSRREH